MREFGFNRGCKTYVFIKVLGPGPMFAFYQITVWHRLHEDLFEDSCHVGLGAAVNLNEVGDET